MSQSQSDDLSTELNFLNNAASPNVVGIRTKLRVADVASAIPALGQGTRPQWIADRMDKASQAYDWSSSDLPFSLEPEN